MQTIIAILLFFAVPAIVAAEGSVKIEKKMRRQTGFIYGLGTMGRSSIYKGDSSKTTFIPLLGYKGEKLSVFGPYLSYAVHESQSLSFTLMLAPRFQSYDASDSDIFSGMDDRKKSADIGAGLKYKENNWRYAVSVMRDALNRSDGTELKTKVGYAYSFGPIFFEPACTLSWLDSKHVNYYYGVTSDEAAVGRTKYKAGHALKSSIDLSVATPIFLGGYTRLGLTQSWYGEEITDSPLVGRDNQLSFRLFFTRYF